ncbi:Hypothetical predicted protein [Marmota monax]|uniref:Uncharacterized protein n=1 Tax=Marmota monax TaxID=9995 RepID=A0A5E4BMX9_MARMO|nr:Hypothetical predicted protein [Marmota monax]
MAAQSRGYEAPTARPEHPHHRRSAPPNSGPQAHNSPAVLIPPSPPHTLPNHKPLLPQALNPLTQQPGPQVLTYISSEPEPPKSPSSHVPVSRPCAQALHSLSPHLCPMPLCPFSQKLKSLLLPFCSFANEDELDSCNLLGSATGCSFPLRQRCSQRWPWRSPGQRPRRPARWSPRGLKGAREACPPLQRSRLNSARGSSRGCSRGCGGGSCQLGWGPRLEKGHRAKGGWPGGRRGLGTRRQRDRQGCVQLLDLDFWCRVLPPPVPLPAAGWCPWSPGHPGAATALGTAVLGIHILAPSPAFSIGPSGCPRGQQHLNTSSLQCPQSSGPGGPHPPSKTVPASPSPHPTMESAAPPAPGCQGPRERQLAVAPAQACRLGGVKTRHSGHSCSLAFPGQKSVDSVDQPGRGHLQKGSTLPLKP